MSREEDLLALIDACLDDGMGYSNIVKAIRSETSDSLMSACDSVVYYLKKSTHKEAKYMLYWIGQNMSRYSHIKKEYPNAPIVEVV